MGQLGLPLNDYNDGSMTSSEMVSCHSSQPIPKSIIQLKQDTIMVVQFEVSIKVLLYIQGSMLLTLFFIDGPVLVFLRRAPS